MRELTFQLPPTELCPEGEIITARGTPERWTLYREGSVDPMYMGMVFTKAELIDRLKWLTYSLGLAERVRLEKLAPPVRGAKTGRKARKRKKTK